MRRPGRREAVEAFVQSHPDVTLMDLQMPEMSGTDAIVEIRSRFPAARIVGQIHPGCSVVLMPKDHPRLPDIPVVIFPGNVGDETALATVYNRLTN